MSLHLCFTDLTAVASCQILPSALLGPKSATISSKVMGHTLLRTISIYIKTDVDI